MPLADSLAFPLQPWVLSALQLVLREQSASYGSMLAPGSLHTSHKMMRNCGAVPPILSPIACVPGQAPAFHVAPLDFTGFRASLILNFPVQAPPPLLSHNVPILFPCQMCSSLVQASALRQQGSCCARGLCLFTVRPGFMCLLGKVGQKHWMLSKA